jgi:hypothetical protein
MANSSSLSDFVRMSAVDDLSYPLACDDRTRDAVNTIVSGRKSWKTLKGKGEAVWPPYLEAALIEGPLRSLLLSLQKLHLPCPSPRQVSSGDVTFNPLFEQVPKSQSLHLGLHLSRHRKAKDCKASGQSASATPGYLRREEESVSLPSSSHSVTDGPLQYLNSSRTVITHLLPKRMIFRHPLKIRTFQMAAPPARPHRNVSSSEVMPRPAPSAHSYIGWVGAYLVCSTLHNVR